MSDIKKRFEEKQLPQTPKTIKRGGSDSSPYFANSCAIQFDLYPHNPVPCDEISLISDM